MAKPVGIKVQAITPELIKQRSFVQTVLTGGISSAARMLGLTPSAVSKNIMRLEAEVGGQLLARDNRSIVVTELGAQAFDAWSELLARLDHVQQALTAPGGANGSIGLSLPSGALPWLMPLLDRYRAAFPNVQLRLNISDASSNLVRDRNDVALRFGWLKDSSERAVSLGSTPLVVCAAPAYLARAGIPATPGDLGEHEGLLFRLPDSGRTRPIMLPDECGGWRMVASIDEGQALVHAALAGLGLIQAPRLLVEANLSSGRLVEVLAPYRPPSLELNLVFQASSWLPAQARAFIDMAKAWRRESGNRTMLGAEQGQPSRSLDE
jgi:LysR family transcriptional regulator for bpeEF and oprC